MKKNYTYLLILVIWFQTGVIEAQQNETMFLMHDLPQTHFINPAIGGKCKINIGLPGAASIHTNYNNTAFTVKELLERTPEGYAFAPGNVIDDLKGQELISAELHYTPFFFGWKYMNAFFTLSLTEKFTTYNTLNADATKLAWYGNEPFIGQEASLSGIRGNAFHYREYALGAAFDINEKLKLGFRTKFLFGKAAAYTANTTGYIRTGNDFYSLQTDFSAEAYASFPVEFKTDAEGVITGAAIKDDFSVMKYFFNRQNFGMALDLGVVYDLNEKITISGSVLDLGYIFWKSDVSSFKGSGSIIFQGAGPDTDYRSDYLQRLSNEFADTYNPELGNDPFTTALPTQIYMGASYKLLSHLNAGATLRNQFYKNRVHSSLTLSVNTFEFNGINGSMSYTFQNGESNFGAGFGAKLGFFHWHLISDHVFAFTDLSDTRNINLRTGFTLIFGCRESTGRNKKNPKGIKALPCVNDPYSKHRRRR